MDKLSKGNVSEIYGAGGAKLGELPEESISRNQAWTKVMSGPIARYWFTKSAVDSMLHEGFLTDLVYLMALPPESDVKIDGEFAYEVHFRDNQGNYVSESQIVDVLGSPSKNYTFLPPFCDFYFFN